MAPRKSSSKPRAAKSKSPSRSNTPSTSTSSTPEHTSTPATEKSNTGSNRPRPIWEGGWTRLQWQEEIAKWESEQS